MNREGAIIPFVTVSSKGLKNGLSTIENDGQTSVLIPLELLARE